MVDFFQPHGPERGGNFPERREGESEQDWKNRIDAEWNAPRLILNSEDPPPPPSGPRFPRLTPRPWWKPVSYILAAGGGALIVAAYDHTHPLVVPAVPIQPTRSPVELTVVQSGEPTFTTPELVKAASRVAEMEQFLKNVLIWPDIRINTRGTLALTEEELNKLLINANVGEREAKWEFNDQGAGYNLNLTYTYEDDGRLSQRFLGLRLTNRVAEPTKPYLDNAGLIRTEYLDSVRRLAIRESRVLSFGPYSANYVNPSAVAIARRGISVDSTSGAQIQVVNDNRGLIRLWETETFYTNPG